MTGQETELCYCTIFQVLHQPHKGKISKRTRRKTTSERTKERLTERDGDYCHYCNIPLNRKNRTVDHKFPRSKGGKHSIANLVLACHRCNQSKADMAYADFIVRALYLAKYPPQHRDDECRTGYNGQQDKQGAQE